MSDRRYIGPPMTLGNMRANGVRRLDISCWICHHAAVLDMDSYATTCRCRGSVRAWSAPDAIIGADARPD
jgi:hypothetical protein